MNARWRAPRRMSLPSLLGLLGAATTAAVIGLLSSYAAWEESRDAAANALQQAEAFAGNVAAAAVNPLLVEDFAALEQMLLNVAYSPQVGYAAITQADGRVVAAVQREHPDHPVHSVFALAPLMPPDQAITVHADTRITAWRAIENSGVRLGWVKTEFDAGSTLLLQRTIWRNAVLAGSGAILLNALLFFLLARHSTRAICAASRFSRGLMDARGEQLPIPRHSTREVAALIDALNQSSVTLHEQKQALAAVARRLSTVLQSTMEGIVVTDNNGCIESINPAAERLFGCAAAEHIGRPLAELWRTQDWQAVLQSDGMLRLDAQHHDGRITPLAISISHSTVGSDGLIVVVARDESERCATEHLLKTAKETAEATAKTKSEFLSNMSHEIRTPLNGVIGLIQLAQDADDSEIRRQYLEKATTSSHLLLGIINDILDFSKIEAGRLDLEQVPFSPRELLQNCRDLFEETAQRKGLGLDMVCDSALPMQLRGDSLRLTQVVNNLISNALKFTTSGKVVVMLKQIERNDQQALLELRVADSGIGMSAEQLARLFKPFTQADGSISRRFGGTGLGLAICKHLVELMGGDIQALSTPGSGTTFVLRLSLPIVDTQVNPHVETAIDYRQLAASYKGLRILLVDDNDVNRLVGKGYLKKAGFSPIMAASGAEALAVLAKDSVDAVLMDMQMPEMDGMETTRRLRTELGLKTLPVIALTAAALQEDKEACLAAGMNDYLTKPFTPEQLVTILAQWLAPTDVSSS